MDEPERKEFDSTLPLFDSTLSQKIAEHERKYGKVYTTSYPPLPKSYNRALEPLPTDAVNETMLVSDRDWNLKKGLKSKVEAGKKALEEAERDALKKTGNPVLDEIKENEVKLQKERVAEAEKELYGVLEGSGVDEPDYLTQTAQAFEETAAGVVNMAGYIIGAFGGDETEKSLKEMTDEWVSNNYQDKNFFIQMIPDAVGAAATLVAGAYGGPPAAQVVGSTWFGTQLAAGAGNAMREAEKYGASTGEMWTTGIGNAAVNYVTERIPLNRMLGKIPVKFKKGGGVGVSGVDADLEKLRKAIKESKGVDIKEVMATALEEGGTEAIAGVSEEALKMVYQNPEDYANLTDYLNAAMESFAGGALLGGGVGATQSAMQNYANDKQRKKAGYVTFSTAKVDGEDVFGEVLGKDEDGKTVMLVDGQYRKVDKVGKGISMTYEQYKSNEYENWLNQSYNEGVTGEVAMQKAKALMDAEKKVRDVFGLTKDVDLDEVLPTLDTEEEAKGVAVEEYRQAKAGMEGVQLAYEDILEMAYQESDESVDKNVNRYDTAWVYSTIYKGEEVFITGGKVVLNEDGTIDGNDSSDALYIKFPNGTVIPVSTGELTEKVSVADAEELKAAGRASIDEQWKSMFDTAEAQAIEQEKRDSGVVFNMTDAQGEHRIEILNEGEEMSEILFDGARMEIPADELNRWKQEAGIQSTENGVQNADAVADDTTDNVAPTGDNMTPAELPDVPDFFRLGGKNYSVASRNDDGSVDVIVDGKRETLPAGTDYSTHMPTDKKGEVQYEQMPVERTHEYFVQKVKDNEARAEMIEKRRKKAEAERKKFDKKPDPGIDPDAYDAKMTQWEADKKVAQAKVDYWNEVAKREAEITRSETREAVEGIQPRDVVEQTAEEFIANQLGGNGIMITPESFRKETGAKSEQKQLVGILSNDGVSIERASEIIWDNYGDELRNLGFKGDQQDVRDAIINILSQGNPRGYTKRSYEARVQDDIDQQRADAEAWAKGAFDMKLEELYLYEETILPRIMRDYEGFDENEYYSNLAENYENDTTREGESIGRGGEVLQGEQSVPVGGTPVVGQRNEGGAVSDDVQGGGQNGVAQEEVPVSEPVGNSEQLSSSEIPNNQSVAEGEGRTESGEVKTESALGETDAPGQSGVYSLSELTDNEGNRFYQKNGSIDLWDLSPLFVQARRQNAPIRLTERNIDHILDEHKKELGDSEESVLKFLDDVFSTAKVLRKARSGGIFVVVENTKTDKAAIIRLYPSKYGDYYNVESAGYYRKNKWKDTENVIAELSEPTQSVTASDVSKPQVPEEGGKELLNAETATTSASEDRNSVSNLQENTQKSGEIVENGGEKKSSIIEETEAEYRNNPLHGVQFSIDADAYNNEDVTFGESEQSTEGGALVSYQDVIYKGQTIGWVKETQSGRMFAPMVTSFYVPLENATEEDKRSPHYFEGEEDYMRFATLQQMVDYINSKPQQGEIQEPVSIEDIRPNGDKRITNYNSRGEVATVAIERDGKVVSVDSYDEGVLFEHTEYDGNGKATSVTRYNKQGNVVGTQVYEDGKAKTPMQRLAEKLNTPIEVRETAEGLTGKKAKAKGWYDVKSGNIVVVVSNHGSIEDIQATVLHEVVAHKGLRQMFGEHFDAFLDNVYNNVDAEIGAEIDALTEKYGNTREATEEYLASLAENTYFEKVNPSLWSRIKQWFLNMLTEAGIKLDFKLSDNELRYILWRSYQRLVNPGIYNPVTRITDVAVRARLGIGEYAPAVEEMAHVAEEDAAEYDNKNQDIFVSNAQRAVEGIQQNKATAEQWIAMLKKNGGLKAGEDAWLGLEEWLNEKQGAVTKQEILDYIAQNRIQIEEVNYTQFGYGLMDEATRKLEAEMKEIGWDAMVEKYPGFDELFEVYNGELLWSEDRASVGEYEDFIIDDKIVDLDSQSNAINETREKYTTEGLERKREIALVVPTVESWNASDEIHFGDAGNGRAVAWVRFGETTDSEGNRVLVIDEIQSKRHQEGREKGYGRATSEDVKSALEAVNAAQSKFEGYNAEMAKKYGSEYDWNIDATDAEIDKWQELYDKVAQLGQVYEDVAESNRKGIPSAPFEKNWHELAMKRMLRLAAEEGFDKVAWTTGEQQAERYNIGAVLKGLKAYKTSANEYYVTPYNNGAIGEFVKEYTEQELADTFGKELAQKIIANTENATEENPYEIEGEELRVGGEGMKGFYDRMLPSFVQKYTKKWGAKVGEVTMPSLEENNTMWSVDVTPEMQESVMQGQTMFRMVSYDEAVQIADNFANTHKGATKRVVISKGKEALEQQMRDAGFTDFSIEVALKDYEGEEELTGGAYYVSSDGIVIYDAEDLYATLWHENAHRVIEKVFGDDLSELQRIYNEMPDDVKDDIANKLKAKRYSEEDFPEEAVCYFVEEAYKNGLLNNGYSLAYIVEQVNPEMKDFANFAQELVNYIDYGRKGIEREGSQFAGKFHIGQQLPERNGESYENGTGADATEGATEPYSDERESTRFRTVEETAEGSIDDIQAQPLTLMERIANSLLEVSAKNKENLELRASALRTFGRGINRVLSLMKVQREYDKSTVDTLVKLAKMYFKNAQLLGEVDTYTMGRVLALINNVVGKRDVTASAAKLMDILLDAHTKALAGILDKAEKVKAKKVNAAGVEVMGRLDKYGQRRVDEYRAAKEMTPEKLEEAIYDSDNRLAELEQRVREELGLPEGDVDQAARDYTGDNDVVNVYMDERARLEGLTLAREYKESIQQVQEEIKDLKRELKQAEEDYRLGNIDGKSLKEFRKSVAEAIIESKAGLIEGYHGLIYKFQENTKESSKKAKAFVQAQIDRAREIQHNANSDLLGHPAEVQGETPDKWNSSVPRLFMSAMPTFQTMLKFFGEKATDGRGYLYERFIPQHTQASHNEYVGKTEAREKMRKKLTEIFGKKTSIEKFMDMSRKDGAVLEYQEGGEKKTIYLTRGQVLYLYMINKMADGRMKLSRMGITDADVQKMAKELPEEFLKFADWVQEEFLTELREKYNKVHERMFGAPMAAIESYFPIKINKRSRGENIEPGMNAEDKPSTVTGSVIKRTKNAVAIDLSADAMQVLLGHVDDMENWSAFAEFRRDVKLLLNYRHFQNQVKGMESLRYGSGEKLWKNFVDVANIAAGSFKPSSTTHDRAVRNIAKGVVSSKIAFRYFTAVKQILSTPAFWSEVDFGKMMNAYLHQKEAWDWAMKNLPGFSKRWEGRASGNEILLESDADWKVWQNRAVQWLSKEGMRANAFIDALTVATGAKAVFETKYEMFKKAGYSEGRAREKALNRAAEAYNESQQSSESAYLSPLQAEATFVSSVLTAYRNSPFGYNRKMATAIANLKKKMKKGFKQESIEYMIKQLMRDGLNEEQAKKFAKSTYRRSVARDAADVALYGFFLNYVWVLGPSLIYILGGDDDEKKKELHTEALIDGAMGGPGNLPAGETLTGAIKAIAEGDVSNFKLPQAVAMQDMETIADLMQTDPVRAAGEVLNILVAMGVGVNPQTFTDMFVALADTEDWGDPREIAMLVLRLINAPNSKLELLEADEAMENYGANIEEITREFAEYQKSKRAPLSGWLYSDESEQKAIERYEERFKKILDERFEVVVENTDEYDMWYENSDPQMKAKLAKLRQKFLEGDKETTMEKLDAIDVTKKVLFGSGYDEVNTVYYELSTAEDEDMAMMIDTKLKELQPMMDEYKKLRGDERKAYREENLEQIQFYNKLNVYKNKVNNLKGAMKKKPEEAQEKMGRIRKIRTKAIDLINNYNE